MALDFPSSPTLNQQFTGGGSSWAWDGTAWNIIPQMAPATASDTPPANPAIGQMWWRATTGALYIYVDDGNSKQWVQTGGTIPAAPQAWELIGDYSFSAIVNFPVINLAPFKRLRLTGWAVPVAAAQIGIRTSADNGATWNSSASDYSFTYMTSAGATVVGNTAGSTFLILCATTDAGTAGHFEHVFENFNIVNAGGADKSMKGQSKQRNGAVTGTVWNEAINRVEAQTAILMVISVVTTMTGSFMLEGVRG